MCRSRAAWTITPASFLRPFSTICPSSAACAREGGTTILPNFTPSRNCPASGRRLGLDRLLAGMEELEMIERVATPAEIFIPYFAADQLHAYLRLAALLPRLWRRVISGKQKLSQQLKYAIAAAFAWHSLWERMNWPRISARLSYWPPAARPRHRSPMTLRSSWPSSDGCLAARRNRNNPLQKIKKIGHRVHRGHREQGFPMPPRQAPSSRTAKNCRCRVLRRISR